MKQHHIITISGTPGSGKSTIAKNLAHILHAKRVYVGGIRRDLAKEKGVTLDKLNEYALEHPETDIDVDQAAAKQARELAKESIVIAEGRVQFHFLKESIKLYIKADLEEGAKRIWLHMQNDNNKAKRNEANVNSLEELIIKSKEREDNDLARYQKYYQLNHTDENNYDFILDTTKINAEQATQQTLTFINQKIA